MATVRFTFPEEEALFDSIPALDSVSITPSVVDPGVSMGIRASVSVSFSDFQYPIAGSEFSLGTFFGKLRAIRQSLQGLPIRVIRGELDDLITEHYVIESLSRGSGDKVTITAKDILKLADGDRAQAPAVSGGRVLTTISDTDLSVTLTPTGIGDLQYPASGRAAIGGSEIVSFTRVADVLTIVRAQSETLAKEHESDEIVQSVLQYSGESPADIIYDLLTNYVTGIDPYWCPLAEWQDDIDTYIARLYSAEIAEPTSVRKLIDELIEQTGLVMWWDEVGQKIRLKSLRPVTGARVISTDEMVAASFKFAEQPNKRMSQVWTYFALRNPLAKLDDTQNYRSVLVTIDDTNTATETAYEQPAIHKIFSRWIAINNRPAADRLNSMLLSRYKDPPRKFSFDVFRSSVAPALGQGLLLEHWSLQDTYGNVVTAPVQVTSLEREEDRFIVDAEELLFTGATDPDGPRIIIIDNNTYNVNLRTLHDSFYTPPEIYDTVICIIEEDVIVGSTSTATPAFDVGSWPANVDITLRIVGRIQGKGGAGGASAIVGEAGGTALFTTYALTVDNDGQIYGGSGGGGGGVGYGGGGGAGYNPGSGGTPGGTTGTTEAGGPGGNAGSFPAGGNGGAPGQNGLPGTGLPSGAIGGSSGPSIDGVSLVTFDSTGTIVGSQIN